MTTINGEGSLTACQKPWEAVVYHLSASSQCFSFMPGQTNHAGKEHPRSSNRTPGDKSLTTHNYLKALCVTAFLPKVPLSCLKRTSLPSSHGNQSRAVTVWSASCYLHQKPARRTQNHRTRDRATTAAAPRMGNRGQAHGGQIRPPALTVLYLPLFNWPFFSHVLFCTLFQSWIIQLWFPVIHPDVALRSKRLWVPTEREETLASRSTQMLEGTRGNNLTLSSTRSVTALSQQIRTKLL